MTLALSVIQGLITAKASLGDLVLSTTLRVMDTKDYVDGEYVKTYLDKPVDVVMDKFSYQEQKLPDYQQTDIKLVLFNLQGLLNPTLQDLMVWNGKELQVIQADPCYVGTAIPVWSIVLRQ